MKHTTAELEGALLDAAVAKAEGWSHQEVETMIFHDAADGPDEIRYLAASTAWSLAGPIIERERLPLAWIEDWGGCWQCSIPRPTEICDDWRWFVQGPTPLIAAMRAYVCSKFGDEVELP